MIRSAEISQCGRFRWTLRREWDSAQPEQVAWIMLNPSTADAEVDDPTIRRCVGFSRDWGFGSLVVVNLFAYRTAYPRELRAAGFPVGERNDEVIRGAARGASLVVAAWGAESHPRARARARTVFDDLTCPPNEFEVYCLGTSSAGAPRHPLMMAASAGRRPLGRLP